MTGAILITGATSAIAVDFVARQLDCGDGPEMYLAVRAGDKVEAELRVSQMLARLYEQVPATAARLHTVPIDLAKPRLGLSGQSLRSLASRVGYVVHCAESTSFAVPRAEARAVNVGGTRELLELARDLPHLQRLVHVSTVFIAGRLAGVLREYDSGGAGFRNTYEWSKLEAEVVVREATDLPTAIVRPSIVVGESDSGWSLAFNGIYWPLQAIARGLLSRLAADPQGLVDTVPVDYVAAVIERALFTPGATGCFHAVSAEAALTVGELVVEACRELERDPPQLTGAASLTDDHPLAVVAPYFDVSTRFDDRRARTLMGAGECPPNPLTYLPRLIDFARDARWGARSLSREAARALAGLDRTGVR